MKASRAPPGRSLERTISGATPREIDALVTAWSAHDRVRALLPIDHDIIDATSGIRGLIVEGLLGATEGATDVEPASVDKDLFHACLVFGRLIAEAGGSPTLAACTIDGARAALAEKDAPWPSARAAVAEGFAAAQADQAKRDASSAWEYPRCAAAVDESTAAIVAGFPEEDGAAITAWADRVASGVLRSGARRAIVSGRDAPRAAVIASLTSAGIDVVEPAARAADPRAALRAPASRGWWPPWRRP